MIKRKTEQQGMMELVYIEQLVPKEHLLRKIDKTIDFRFIYDKVKDRYCPDDDMPAVDPIVLFKMLFIGYLFGIRSEQQLIREIEVNAAYRWFLGFTLTDKIPHASTFSQNRRRRFNDSPVYQEIFDEIFLQAIKRKMVDGKTLYSDSTHLKASANKGKYDKAQVLKSVRDYVEELAQHGKKPLPPRDETPETKEIKVSTTDPDSGYMVREGKPKGFFYLDHRSVDGICGIIADSFVTPPPPRNVHDSQPYLSRLDRQRKRFGFNVEPAGLDAAYFTPHICKGLVERDIYGVIGYSRPTHRAGYREYVSDPSVCRNCCLLGQCTASRNHTKAVTRHIWQGYKDIINEHRYEDKGKAIYKRRKETVERSFADGKELHGHRYARFRGLAKVQMQCLLSAACQKMKKIALRIWERSNSPCGPGFFHFQTTLSRLFSLLWRICSAPKSAVTA